MHNPNVGFGIAGANGRLVYLYRDHGQNLFFRLTAFDLKRPVAGEIPVVRDHEFATSLLELIDVPMTATSRVMLRIYDVDDRDNAAVTVRIFSSNDLPMFEQLFIFNPSGFAHPHGFPSGPGFRAIPLQDLIGANGKVRMEIEAATPSLRFWAFVTVTDNTTGAIQVIAP